MTRGPRSSTLFPYTTLFRSVWEALERIPDPEIPVISLVDLGVVTAVEVSDGKVDIELTPTFLGRSEEHTSELQSQSNLVCRLLLEKKKKKHDRTNGADDKKC